VEEGAVPAGPEALPAASVVAAARAALGDPTAAVRSWEARALGGSWGKATAGLHRVAGAAAAGGRPVRWSVVLKTLAPEGNAARAGPAGAGPETPSAPDYWRREALVYGSGLLDRLPAGVAAPRCYAAEEGAGGARLWLEDVADDAPGPWGVARHALAARHLGRLNGASLTGRPLPDAPWLARGVWRARHGGADGRAFDELGALRAHPLVRELWPAELETRARRACADRFRFFDAADRLPRVFRHGDTVRPNLLGRRAADGVEETVLVDWALAGVDAVGDDLCGLVAQALTNRLAPAGPTLEELDAACFDAYVAGLRDAGWRGPGAAARLGFCAGAAVRYPLFPLSFERALTDDALRPRLEHAFGRPVETLCRVWVDARRFALDRADEARELLATGL
jgi:hypothetical protein